MTHPLQSVGPAQIRKNPGDEPVDGAVIAVDAPSELNLDGTNPQRLVGDVVMDHGFGELRDGYAKLRGV